MMSFTLIIAFALLIVQYEAFRIITRKNMHLNNNIMKMKLDEGVVNQLEEMKTKFDRISAVDSPEVFIVPLYCSDSVQNHLLIHKYIHLQIKIQSNAEASALKETVEKYKTYTEVKKLMIKIRSMYKQEAR